MNIQSIPLTKLVPSASNVRKTGTKLNIEELAASIAAHGLLQNLQVKFCNGSGTFEVVAGGRRLKALKFLAKQKQIKKSFKVTCNVLTDEDSTEISLAENIIRLPMPGEDDDPILKTMRREALREFLPARGPAFEGVRSRFPYLWPRRGRPWYVPA